MTEEEERGIEFALKMAEGIGRLNERLESQKRRIQKLEKIIDRAGALASQKASHEMILDALSESKQDQQKG